MSPQLSGCCQHIRTMKPFFFMAINQTAISFQFRMLEVLLLWTRKLRFLQNGFLEVPGRIRRGVIRKLYIFYFSVLALMCPIRLSLWTKPPVRWGSSSHYEEFCHVSSSIFILLCPGLYMAKATTSGREYRVGQLKMGPGVEQRNTHLFH